MLQHPFLLVHFHISWNCKYHPHFKSLQTGVKYSSLILYNHWKMTGSLNCKDIWYILYNVFLSFSILIGNIILTSKVLTAAKYSSLILFNHSMICLRNSANMHLSFWWENFHCIQSTLLRRGLDLDFWNHSVDIVSIIIYDFCIYRDSDE